MLSVPRQSSSKNMVLVKKKTKLINHKALLSPRLAIALQTSSHARNDSPEFIQAHWLFFKCCVTPDASFYKKKPVSCKDPWQSHLPAHIEKTLGEDSCKEMGLWKLFWRCFSIRFGKGGDELRVGEGCARKTQHPTPLSISQGHPQSQLIHRVSET